MAVQDDLNRVGEVFGELVQNNRLNAECRVYNKEMTDIVNAYKSQRANWDNQPDVTENAFPSATQSLWYSHYLNKRRLRNLGIETRCEKMGMTTYPPEENQRLYIRYEHDGRNLICKIVEPLRYRKVYYQNGRQIGRDGSEGRDCEYYVIRSQAVTGRCICPKCGYEDTIENLVDGCDYCHTKFHIQDFDGKVSSIYMPNDNKRSRDNNPFKKFNTVLYIIVVLIAFPILISIPILGIPLIFLGLIIFLSVYLTRAGKLNMKEGAGRSRETVAKIRKVDPLFSAEYLIGNLTNKLESIYYADRMEDIGAFTYCDISPYIARNRNVFGFNLLECVLMDYTQDDRSQTLEVQAAVQLLALTERGMGKGEEKIRLRLAKSPTAKTSAVNDIAVYTCQSCGASVSLLNGGHCEYCGGRMDMFRYDWVITGFGQV